MGVWPLDNGGKNAHVSELKSDIEYVDDVSLQQYQVYEHQLYQGLAVDPTHNCDEDTLEDTIPVEDVKTRMSKYGARGVSQLSPTDAGHLLTCRRSACESAWDKLSVNDNMPATLYARVPLVPRIVYNELLCQYPDVKQLERLLAQSWALTWEGWPEVQEQLRE